MANAATAKIVGGKLVITMDLNPKPQESASGKSLVVSTTGGFTSTDAKVNGKAVSISVNAIIKP